MFDQLKKLFLSSTHWSKYFFVVAACMEFPAHVRTLVFCQISWPSVWQPFISAMRTRKRMAYKLFHQNIFRIVSHFVACTCCGCLLILCIRVKEPDPIFLSLSCSERRAFFFFFFFEINFVEILRLSPIL